jgi:drug/metabolite transporter (DMT)-like permease
MATAEMAAGGMVALWVTCGVFVMLWAILAKRGAQVATSACCFVAALVSTQLLMKRLSSPPYSFRYPGLVTALHFSLVWLACLVYWSAMGEPGKNWPGSMGSARRFAKLVLPIALSNPLTVVFNNKALVHVGAGLCAVIGTLSPVAVALLARVFGRRMSVVSWLGIFVAFSGGVLITKTEVHGLHLGSATAAAAAVGIGFALASVGLRAFKIVLMDNLLAPSAYQGAKGESRAEPTLSPMHVYALQAPWSALVSVVFALCTESVSSAYGQLTAPVIGMIGMTSISAVSLNFLGIFSLRDLGASMQQIIGKLNTICTMALSVGLLGESLPGIVLVGSGIVLFGVAIFEQGKRSPADTKDTVGSSPPGSHMTVEEQGAKASAANDESATLFGKTAAIRKASPTSTAEP